MDLKNNQITVQELLAHPQAASLLKERFPGAFRSPLLSGVQNTSLSSVIKRFGGLIPASKLEQTLQELRRL